MTDINQPKKDRLNRASLIYDKETHDKYKKYCKENGYKIEDLTSKIINEYLNSKISKSELNLKITI